MNVALLLKSWEVLAFRQLVKYKYKRAALLVGGGAVALAHITPQPGPHDSAAIPAALPQGEKLD